MSDRVNERIDRNERDIEDLRKMVSQGEKAQTAMEVSLKYLSENINKLTKAVDSLTQEVKHITFQVEPIKSHIENNKGFAHFFKENWFRIPTLIVIFYVILYGVGTLDPKRPNVNSTQTEITWEGIKKII